ncbi:hypothetical protein GWR56_13480 [Mucilaginibacter sp. 14171R-50]|uniref:hypothetical protein n=1 Tax=Mucilaginibacter sp. 14171R-50 TaxID=2703789 RepID=UPI00138D2FB2|nr:hypothetical protein [Mucilaginibacter sp. 14171R-50]QHS56499.1 hypothetical protein GWR56_13480 [Mucilaginibacter sp. 14171R-50]
MPTPQPLPRHSSRPGRLTAASLYIVIVVALVIALLCEALIASAFYYRAYHAQRNRLDRLDNRVSSGLNLILSDGQRADYRNELVDLFERGADTVRLSRYFWGGFDIGVSRAGSGRDSAFAAILIGNELDSLSRFAIWLADEDRPLSVSGRTAVVGDVYLPKAGVRSAYVNSHGYEGEPAFIAEVHRFSKRELPEPDILRLARIDQSFSAGQAEERFIPDTLTASFGLPTREYRLKAPFTLKALSLQGNIIIRCDSLLTIDSTAALEQVMIFAPAIVVRPGFRGRCQLFARDSISIGDRAAFAYPSVAALLRTRAEEAGKQGFIRFGRSCSFFGGLLAWEKLPGVFPPAVYLGSKGTYQGQIYTGLLGLGDSTAIAGSVTCRRFFYRSGFSNFENYLIGARIDAHALSPFYLSPAVFPGQGPSTKKIVQWLK